MITSNIRITYGSRYEVELALKSIKRLYAEFGYVTLENAKNLAFKEADGWDYMVGWKGSDIDNLSTKYDSRNKRWYIPFPPPYEV